MHTGVEELDHLTLLLLLNQHPLGGHVSELHSATLSLFVNDLETFH